MSICCRLEVQMAYFEQIQSGQKTVEGRIAKEKYLALSPGDTIEICSQEKSLVAVVEEVKKFTSFAAYLEYYGINHCLPGVSTIDLGVKLYRGFPGYQEQEEKIGVVGIKIKVKE